MSLFFGWVGLVGFAAPVQAQPAGAGGELAATAALIEQGYGFQKKYCIRCHGEELVVQGLDLFDRAGLIEGGYLKPGSLEGSSLWNRAGVEKDMPPEEEPQPTAAEIAGWKAWILAGAPYPALQKRELVTTEQTVRAIRDYLRGQPERSRRYLRFFTLTNLNNNAASVTDDEYRLYLAALSKTVNSLSWKPRVVVPVAVDPARTLLAIDLRDYGWEREGLWGKIVQQYPYGLDYSNSSDEVLRTDAAEVYQLAGTTIPQLRADWFIAQATRPPLYHLLMDLPTSATTLETLLRVDVNADFLNDRLARAGFATSGVSGQNRLVDRHDAAYGYYWKSYDFKTNKGRGNLFLHPLGPPFPANPYREQFFEHDGGEMIFSLPNGLQGYYLSDGQNNRIDAGPIEVVSDKLKTSGTPEIVNGLSCMACHKHGTITFIDTIRAGVAVSGTPLQKVQALFPPKEKMDAILAADEAKFVRALEQAIGPFLKTGADANRDIREFPEPVGAIARRYHRDLAPAEVAAELGLADAKQIQTLIQYNPRLRQMGLGPLLAGQTIKRESWDSLENVLSLFHTTALELDLGTPHRILD